MWKKYQISVMTLFQLMTKYALTDVIKEPILKNQLILSYSFGRGGFCRIWKSIHACKTIAHSWSFLSFLLSSTSILVHTSFLFRTAKKVSEFSPPWLVVVVLRYFFQNRFWSFTPSHSSLLFLLCILCILLSMEIDSKTFLLHGT